MSREVETQHGPARVHVHLAADPVGALVLGHGAGGGVGAPDLVAVVAAALAVHVTVATVDQPYRVAGRRAPAPARQLDAAWEAVLADLVGTELLGLPVVVGGRSSGGRVACRTVAQVGAVAVLCLAFPLVPPRAPKPTSRAAELDAVTVPVLVVQGARDRFGRPEAAPGRELVLVPGDHSLHTDPAAVADAVAAWLPGALSPG